MPRATSGLRRLMRTVTSPPLRHARRFNSNDSLTSQDSTPSAGSPGHDASTAAAIDSSSQSSTGSMLDDVMPDNSNCLDRDKTGGNGKVHKGGLTAVQRYRNRENVYEKISDSVIVRAVDAVELKDN